MAGYLNLLWLTFTDKQILPFFRFLQIGTVPSRGHHRPHLRQQPRWRSVTRGVSTTTIITATALGYQMWRRCRAVRSATRTRRLCSVWRSSCTPSWRSRRSDTWTVPRCCCRRTCCRGSPVICWRRARRNPVVFEAVLFLLNFKRNQIMCGGSLRWNRTRTACPRSSFISPSTVRAVGRASCRRFWSE